MLFRDDERPLGLLDAAARTGAPTWPGPAGGRRAALRLPRLAVRRRAASAWRRPAEPAGQHAPVARSGDRLPGAGTHRHRLGVPRSGRSAGLPDLDCFAAPDALHLRLQGPDRVQLAAGPGGGDRSCARVLPAPVRRGRGPGGQLRQAVPRRLPRHRPADDRILREYGRPEIIQWSDRLRAAHSSRCARLPDGSRTHVRITNQVFPHAFTIPLSATMRLPSGTCRSTTSTATGTPCSPASPAGGQGRGCAPSASSASAAGLQAAAEPVQQLRLRPAGATHLDLYRYRQ